ncbi:MAG: CHAT domain-containing protein [Xenococcaceae cyanobacterium MO_188.B32]|nr:CHAT domain-containing protein [Xenococcaceae cyanobacterium MO_188.B32]
MTTKILVLASNPQGTEQLLLNQEIRAIKDALERAKKREQFVLIPTVAVRVKDLQSTILEEKPNIVHFCGHGTGSQGLVLETESGQKQLINTQAIGDLFKLSAKHIESVVLNACYSQAQASVINQYINYVIGTKKSIRDDAAIAFTRGFYLALFNGESIDRAYEFGCNRIQLDIYSNTNQERKLVPVYSEAEGKSIELPQHKVLVLLTKNPLNKLSSSTAIPTNFANPFNHLAGRIEDSSLIFGREKEIKNIFELLNSNNSVAIIGEPEIGKSSVLKLIEEQSVSKLIQPRKPIYLNLGEVYDEEDFYYALCELVGIPELKGFKLSRALKKHKLLLILDNVENMAWDGFTNQIRSQIRALAEGINAPLRLVIAASKPLNCLFPDSGMVSPFENVCVEESIHKWCGQTIRNFITSRLKDNPISFTQQEIAMIIQESNGHPKSVMRLCYDIYQLYR